MITGPFLKWTGGKRRLLPRLLPYFWRDGKPLFTRYYEGFLGSGPLALDLMSRNGVEPATRFVLTDTNAALIRTWRTLRDGNLSEVARHLITLRDMLRAGADRDQRQAVFETVRAVFNQGPGDSPEADFARFYFLNKTAFNGLYRVNRDGDFNAPFGEETKNGAKPRLLTWGLEQERHLQHLQDLLRSTSVQFFETSALALNGLQASPDDAHYFDPPYVDVTEDERKTFTGYTAESFGEVEHTRLATLAGELQLSGARVVLSNFDSEMVRDLYPESRWHLERVSVRHNVGASGRSRGRREELIISSHPKE